MAYLSPADVLKLQIEVLGETAGRLYNAIWNEVVYLRIKWQEYRLIYREGAKQISLLNEIAPFFFYYLQTLMIDDIILHLNRITGPTESVGKDNLTIRWLPELLAPGPHPEALKELVLKSVGDAEFTKDRRNRHIAHSDLGLFTTSSAKPLDPITYEQIDKALSSLWGVIVHIESVYFRSSTIDYAVRPPTGAEALMHFLANAHLDGQ